jgi:hypothetical protein
VITDSKVWENLDFWTGLARKNEPRIVKYESKPEWLVVTDASAWGWGYVALNQVTGEVRGHGQQWSNYMHRVYGEKLGRSTFAEPTAIVNSLCHLLPRNSPTQVLVGTDNTVAQAAYTRGFNSHSFDINERLRRLQDTFGPDYLFRFKYIPGAQNDADPWSRGERIAGGEVNGDSLRRLLGQI